ncbi:DNA polymerase III subunit delta [Mordavella massiliensis]|uniref:DNA polymerase III subunit delta n=1 Tax=Mordavella massiliensis TaxID=1871024 RepID=A0A939BGN9_9CLOT|nr:DNA polymerase III subunit delta [Mordavella massiliensis]MBM6948265.1 DNA polymerase III subunit delta [Mordavella massiliensis]
MKQLNEDLKTGKLKNVYLLCGEEAYLKRQYRNRIRRAAIPEGDTMNYAYYEGKNIPVPEIIDLAETMPFFAERRLIVIENSGFFKTASQELADYIRVMPDTVLLLFVESEVDKRGRLYKAVKDRGSVVELGYQDERTLTLWIASAVKRENKKIREDTVHLLLSRAGTDMENLEQELEKLFSYTASREEITSQDVEEICTTRLENRIFEMVDAVAQKEQKKALDYYYDLVALREPPLKILALLTRQFRLLLEVKDLMRQGQGKAQIAKGAGIHPYVAGKCMQQSRGFSGQQLREILEDGADLEEAAKSGRLDPVMSVEIFIVKYSARA